MSRSVTVVLHEREGGRAAVCAVFDTRRRPPTHFLPSYAVNSGIDWPSRSCTRPAASPRTRSCACPIPGRSLGRVMRTARRPATVCRQLGGGVGVSGLTRS